MRTPLQSRSATSADRMLDATLDLLAEGGLGAVTVAAVARAARTSNGSLYHRFGDRAGLLLAAQDRALGAIETQTLAAFARADAEPATDAGDEAAVANWNGGFWDDTARAAGLAVGTLPVSGAIVTFDPGTQGITAATGHVAFVESVSSDGSFVVSEMNAPLPSEVTQRRISAAGRPAPR